MPTKKTLLKEVAIPGTQLWGGFTQYDRKESNNVFYAYVSLVHNAGYNPPDQNIAALFYDKDGFAICYSLTNANGEVNHTTFTENLAIPKIGSTLTSDPESEISLQFTGPTSIDEYANWFTGTAKRSFRSLDAIDELHHEFVPKSKAAAPNANFSTLFELQPLTNTTVSNSVKRGGNVLGLEAVVADGPKLNWVFPPCRRHRGEPKSDTTNCPRFYFRCQPKQRSLGTYALWIYLNCAWADEQPYPHCGAENTALLAEVSTAYDPENMVQKLRKTLFKINGRCFREERRL